MRIKAEAKIITLGDLKAAVRAFEEQGFKDRDVMCPPSKWLPPESPDTTVGMTRMLSSLSKAMGEGQGKSLGIVLWMCREINNTDLPG